MDRVPAAVEIRVEHADALFRPSEVLVVKYAQALYGLDARVADELGLSQLTMPAIGSHIVVDTERRPRTHRTGLDPLPRIGAAAVVFLGVPSLYRFGYKEIRDFGRRALSATAEVRPQAREICLTVHGPGYGLDEVEAFESEVAGVLDAVAEQSLPRDLQVVTFLEGDRGRAQRLHEALSTLLPGGRTGSSGRLAADRLRSVGYDSGTKRHAFVAMPFAGDFEDTFHFGIAPSIRDAGFVCERIDNIAFTGDIVLTMKERIGNASFVVADLTGANPNVYLEVGYAWGRDIPTVLACKNVEDLKFDIRGQRCLVYGSIRDLKEQLSREISTLFA